MFLLFTLKSKMFSGKGVIPEIYKQCYIMVMWISEMIPFFLQRTLNGKLTFFFPMFLFDPPENIRETLVL